MMLLQAWILQQATAVVSLMVVVEDVHWSDPSLVQFLPALARRLSKCRGMLVMTCRSGYVPVWPEDAPLTRVMLSPLDPQEAAGLLDSTG
jgi:predicted ATPase